MSDKKDLVGVQYSMNSWNASNVREANEKLGYNKLSDNANRDKQPQGLQGAKVCKQSMGGNFGY